MGGSDFAGAVLSNSNLKRLPSGDLELADGEGITIFRFSEENFSFPQWEKNTKDGSKVCVNIVETINSAILPKHQIPKKIEGVDSNSKSGVVITSMTELTSLNRVADLRASDFRISPDQAKVVWDDDLQSFIK